MDNIQSLDYAPCLNLCTRRLFLGVTAALVGGGLAFIFYNQSTSRSTYVDRESQVTVSVSYSTAACNDTYPLHITISNRADKVLEKVEWYVAAFVSGRSTDITKYKSYSQATNCFVTVLAPP